MFFVNELSVRRNSRFVLWYFIVFVRVHGLMLLCLASHSASSLRLWVFFPFGPCGLSFLCGDLERSLTRPCGSTAADSWRYMRSRDQDLCCLPEPTGHHHRHSLDLVSVEARVIEIMVVIAHAIHFQFLLFLFHQQWRSWGQLWWQSR